MSDIGVAGFVPPRGFGQDRACGECGGFHTDPLVHERERVQERRRGLLEAVRAGERFVAEKDFQAAGVGATSHLLGPGRSLDEWRSRSGKTVRYAAGDELDAATVQRLMAEGRDVPVRVATPASRQQPPAASTPPAPAAGAGSSEPSVWDRLLKALELGESEPAE